VVKIATFAKPQNVVRHTKDTVTMKVKLGNQNIFILCWTFLVAVTISCNSQSQSNKENQIVHSKDNSTRLKYTTGVRSILEDSKGNTWFGSYNEGVSLLHNGKFQYFTTENGLSNNQVRNIYEDGNGIIWFECGRGLSTYNGQQMTIYKERDFSAENKWELNSNDLWFMSDLVPGYSNRQGDREGNPGILQYNGKELFFRKFPVTQDSGDVFDHSVSTPFVKGKNGTFWIGTYTSVIGYNGSDFKIIDNAYLGFSKEIRSLHVRSIMEDSKGNLWIGNNGIGVLKYDGEKVVNFTEQQKLKKEDTNGNSLERVFSIGQDTLGNIWFGTRDFGVWRYDGKSVKNFTKEDGLESKQIWTIYTSKQGELWFGGANPSGVYRFNDKSFERKY